jgi:hypothetical protein
LPSHVLIEYLSPHTCYIAKIHTLNLKKASDTTPC